LGKHEEGGTATGLKHGGKSYKEKQMGARRIDTKVCRGAKRGKGTIEEDG